MWKSRFKKSYQTFITVFFYTPDKNNYTHTISIALKNTPNGFLGRYNRQKITSRKKKSLQDVIYIQLTRNRSKDVWNENLHQSLVHHMVTVTHPFQNWLIFAQSYQLCFRKSTFYFTQIAGVNKCIKWINENAFTWRLKKNNGFQSFYK